MFDPDDWEPEESEARIDRFVAETTEMIGSKVDSDRWHSQVNADQSDVWLNGIGDRNPRWQPTEPGADVHPTYIVSVASPGMVFGAPMPTPLENLVGSVEVRWDEPLHLGDTDLAGSVTIEDVDETEKAGRRYVFLSGACRYRRDDEVVAEAETTLIRTPKRERQDAREIYEYDTEELEAIRSSYEAELDRLQDVPATPSFDDLAIGDSLPSIVRGPLTIADMVCWNAAMGPTYGAHIHNFYERTQAADGTVINPSTGWVQKDSHQHEDFLLTEQRGMPLPFANGINMWALTSPLVTNWMGRDGFLERHTARLQQPYFYGDVLWIDGEVSGLDEDSRSATIAWEAINPHDEAVIAGSSAVRL